MKSKEPPLVVERQVTRFDVKAQPLQVNLGQGVTDTGTITVTLNEGGENTAVFDLERGVGTLDVLIDVAVPALKDAGIEFPPLRIRERGRVLWGLDASDELAFWWDLEGGGTLPGIGNLGPVTVHAIQKLDNCKPDSSPGPGGPPPCEGGGITFGIELPSQPAPQRPFPEIYDPFPPSEPFPEMMPVPEGFRPLAPERVPELMTSEPIPAVMAFAGFLRTTSQQGDILFEGLKGNLELSAPKPDK
ncbi:MAG: hypothetical protein ACRD1T_23675 [Acidimicrobiia bacterium]